MSDKKGRLEQMIQEEFMRTAKEEEDALCGDDSIIVPEGRKESIYLEISEKIQNMGQEKQATKKERKDTRHN